MSILGFASRHPLVTLGAVAGLWWSWPDGSSAPAPAPPPAAHPQAAVLADGFAAIDARGRIAVLDDEAERRREIALTGAPAGARVVGLAGHVGLVWRDGKRVAVAAVDDDGSLEGTARFGKRVASMCEGVATNEHEFGVAWFEADGSVWFVHGPTSPRGATAAGATAAEAPLAVPAKADFCAIASAGDRIALLFTEGSRTTLALCGRQCTPRRLELPKKSAVLGLGCTRGGCAIATRGAGGAAHVTWVTPQGKARWTRPLPHASPDTRVALAGTGAAVAIAYATANEPVVVIASAGGELATAWQGASDDLPSIVHAAGRLLVARTVDGEITGSLVAVP
ncbi:MAG TPA: hypothetical protein VK932_23115 [Kofleriaceae bacterium]|nr:hypothetical protein [Kofleriaceae bacterium]